MQFSFSAIEPMKDNWHICNICGILKFNFLEIKFEK